jgi:hypothetical protein
VAPAGTGAGDQELVADELAVGWSRRLVKHARYYWLLLTNGHLHRRLFSQMLHQIGAPPVPSE